MSSGFYVRARGKVTGPYDIATLQKLAQRGALSRAYEISSDRTSWTPAGEFEDLFPPGSNVPEPATSPTAAAAQGHGSQAPAYSPAAASSGDRWYYAQGGNTMGPVPLATLMALAGGGQLRAADVVWRDGAQYANQASQVAELARYFVAVPQAGAGTGAGGMLSYERPHDDPIAARRHLDAMGLGAAIIGIVTGVLIVLCLNLPWYGPGGSSRASWWWDIFEESGSRGERGFLSILKVSLVYYLLAGIMLCILSPLLKRMARGITLMSISLFGILLLLLMFASMPEGATGTGMGIVNILYLTFLAGLVATSNFRVRAPAPTYGKVFHGIMGGLILMLALITVIYVLSNTETMEEIFGSSRGPGNVGSMPAWAVIAVILMVGGALSGLAAGVCALISLGVKARGLLRTTQICSIIAFAAPPLGVFVLAIGGATETGSDYTGRIILFVFRIVVLVYGLFLPLMAGLGETLAAPYFGPMILGTGAAPQPQSGYGDGAGRYAAQYGQRR